MGTKKFDKKIINLLTKIGFKNIKEEYTGIGTVWNYKYYPEYLNPNHYTFIFFKHNTSGFAEHRLYIHTNNGGKYVNSLYNINSMTEYGKSYIEESIEIIFKKEITCLNRNLKLSQLV